MSTIKLSRKILFLSTLFFVGIAVNTAYAQLPENHPYQKTLINYMGTLKQSDFKVDLQPLTVKASYFNSADQAYRAWLFFGHLAHSMMGTRGLRVGASNFTLSSIEANGQVNMTVGRDEFMNPIATAFWAIWDYKGNPHYGSRAVKLRAFVASAVDMIMQDQNFEQGHNKRSDFLGMQLTRWAFVYGAVKDILPAKVRTAYQKGLVKMFNRLIKWGPTGIHADMDMAATEGVLYTAKFVTIQDLTQQAHQYIQKLMNNFLKAPGYIGHGSAYDAGYNGISLYFLNWAAQISGYKPLIQALKKMSKFKAYMTLPDPDGQRYSPFQSNPSSGTDAPHDLWGPYYRDVGIAKYSNNAAYLALKGGNSTIESKSTMLKQMNHMLQYFNDPTGYLAFTGASDKTPGKWHSNHWNDTNSLNATAFYYKKGLYGRLKNIKNNQPSLTKPPFARQGTFTKNFANKYLSVKRQTYGTIIDNDRLSWWTHKGQTKTLNGFGGGNMAAFWTPKTGSVILGGTRTGHHGGLDLKDWRIWPVNALSGETADGIPFSSGLQRFPKANYALSQTPKIVTITGNLAGTYSDPRNGLQGTVTYKRVFQVKKNGVQVTTSVSTGSSNKVKDLYEILPVYRRNAYSQSSDSPTSIEFKVNGSWQQAGTTLKKVSSIRLQRFQGTVFIDFENPVMVKLSSHDFYKNPTQKHGLQARNIMIAMLKNEGQSTTLTNASVTYFLRSSKAKPNQNWSDPSQSGTSGSSSTDTTAPTV
ncbi:MAG TPA: hypothetical protein VE868_04400, partial [Balneolaceae bacterium]|nr:hypothetical protein [Balneolaceae bacterium]